MRIYFLQLPHVMGCCLRTLPEYGSHRVSIYMVHCAERNFDSADQRHPVKAVVFDFDETLTLTTLMPKDMSYDSEAAKTAYSSYNFDTPYVDGDRVAKLKHMLHKLAKGKHCSHRMMAILTKNSRGMEAVLALLQIAGLADCFDAIWVMPFRQYVYNGMYRDGNEWKKYRREMGEDRWWRVSHKADVLHMIAQDPVEWFPQILDSGGKEVQPEFQHLLDLRPESIVLVDDLRNNFSSETGKKVLRYCKVARYDAEHEKLGFITDMGGIGSHSDQDYTTLIRFVEFPWRWKETLQVECHQWYTDHDRNHHPVTLVVFDFDETLTVATFMPTDPACCTKIGWSPDSKSDFLSMGRFVPNKLTLFQDWWSTDDLVTYNFESPYVEWSRVRKLKSLLLALQRDPHEQAYTPNSSPRQQRFADASQDGSGCRRLAIATRNKCGVVAILNLLLLADLAEYFSAIWAIPETGKDSTSAGDLPTGVYQQDGVWKTFETPMSQVHAHKADVIHHVAENPLMWFPQFSSTRAFGCGDHPTLDPEGIVLVDDERFNFRSDVDQEIKVLRYCKVPRFDDVYRDCGLLNQLGGIGAHDESDFETLRHFVEEPWKYPITEDLQEPISARRRPPMGKARRPSTRSTRSDRSTNTRSTRKTPEQSWDIPAFRREMTEETLPKKTRARSPSVYSPTRADIDTGEVVALRDLLPFDTKEIVAL